MSIDHTKIVSIKEMQVVQEFEVFELHAFSPSTVTMTSILFLSKFVNVCRNFCKIFQNISSMQKNKFLSDNQVLFYKAHFQYGLKILYFTVAVRS